MAKGKPLSDSEIRPETPWILDYLEGQHYNSQEWHRDAGIKNRGLGLVEVEDQFTDSVDQIETIPASSSDANKGSK